jgi:hypothetical protein
MSLYNVELIGTRDAVQKAGLGLPLGLGPVVVLLLKVTLDPGDGDGGPDAGPEEGENPADLPSISIPLERSRD